MMSVGTGHDQRRSQESGTSMGRHRAASSGDLMKMHVGEANIDEALVTRLVVAQFPDLADLLIRAVPSMGTVNAIYRLGDHLCARLPRLSSWARDLHKELTWLPKLAPSLALCIPKPLAQGQPTSDYPFAW